MCHACLIVPCRLTPSIKPRSIILGQVTRFIAILIEGVSEGSASAIREMSSQCLRSNVRCGWFAQRERCKPFAASHPTSRHLATA